VPLCSRAKLFRYGDGQWKERGKGDLRLLKHTESGRVRVVMREDLMAALLRANHAVPPAAELVSASCWSTLTQNSQA
jgi:Ran-binding protein 1